MHKYFDNNYLKDRNIKIVILYILHKIKITISRNSKLIVIILINKWFKTSKLK